MKLAYVAYDRAGRQTADTIEAVSAADAAETLRRRGLFVARLGGDSRAQARPASPPRNRARRSGRLKKVAMFMRQLHVLVASGTPVVQSLTALERQAREGPWRDVIADVRSRVERGASLSIALGNHPDCFDPVCLSLVAAGESSGQLPQMLDRLATVARRQLQIRNAVTGALIYPSLLLVITIAVLSLLLLFVVPRFGALFHGLGMPLPPTTAAMVAVGVALQSYWWAGILMLAGGGTGLRFWLASAAGKRAWDTIVLRLPQAGRIVKSFAAAHIARLLGVLLEGHVPILEALRLVEQSTKNSHYAALVASARDSVARGESMSSAFNNAELISPSVYEAIHSGEQSGQVGAMLLNIADFQDEENEVVVRSLTSIMEPAILVVLGVLVGLVAMSMFLPLFDLTAMTGGGGGGG
jgi:type IV pilus assembly protein PilC